MIRFLLVLLAFVSALLAFMFQETVLFVASGGLLMVSVVLLLLQVREQSKRKNRLKLPNELTPDDELRARGVLEIRPKAKAVTPSSQYAPSVLTERATQAELKLHGISDVRAKPPKPSVAEPEFDEIESVTAGIPSLEESVRIDSPDPEQVEDDESAIPWSLVSSEELETPELFSPSASAIEESDGIENAQPIAFELETDLVVEGEFEEAFDPEPVDEMGTGFSFSELTAAGVEDETTDATPEEIEASSQSEAETMEQLVPSRESVMPPLSRRHVEVDAHLPALQTSLGAHTICLIDVDTDSLVYRLRSIVSSGPVDHAGTEYPFAGFFLSDLLAETTVIEIGPSGLALPDLRFLRDPVELVQVVAAPVMRGGLPAAFLVAGFENTIAASCRQAVTRAADFFSSLYALKVEHPSKGESPLVRAKRKPPSLRLVKSNPKSSQSKIIAEEMNRARGSSYPLAFALVCLDKGDEISQSDEMTVYQVEEWMRKCLEQITPDGRIEYLGELGYGIIQLRDVTDVEGWVRRAQQVFRSQHGPVDAHPIVGVAMLSEGHRHPEDLQADAVRALRAAYETGDSTILVG